MHEIVSAIRSQNTQPEESEEDFSYDQSLKYNACGLLETSMVPKLRLHKTPKKRKAILKQKPLSDAAHNVVEFVGMKSMISHIAGEEVSQASQKEAVVLCFFLVNFCL